MRFGETLANAAHHWNHSPAASRAEPGCLEYSYAEDVLEAGLMHINELWDTRAHLQAHFRSDHIAAWRVHWADLQISDRNLRLYEVGEPEPT